MKKIIILLIGFLGFLNLHAQAPLIPSVRCSLTTVTVFTDPYTVTGKTSDFSSNWQASDIAAGDSLYLLDGSELRIYRVVSISSASGADFTIVIDDINNSGNVPVTGEYGALFRGTTNYDFPNVTAGISETLQMAIQNRFAQRLDALLKGIGTDYITTDSFSTFTNSATFASIPLNKTVWRTTTGSKFEKTNSTTMTKRSTDNGELARLGLQGSGAAMTFNANLYNKVKVNTGDISATTIQNPTNFSTQEVGEVFLIGVTAGSSDVAVTWGDIYGTFNGSTFGAMPATSIPAQMTIYFKFRVITPSVETVKFQYVDGGGSGDDVSTFPIANSVLGTERIVLTNPDSAVTFTKLTAQLRDSTAFDAVRTIYARTAATNDYNAFPSSLIRNDTIFVCWKTGADHNLTANTSTSGIKLGAFSALDGRMFWEEWVAMDSTGSVFASNNIIGDAGYGKIVVFYTLVFNEGVIGSVMRDKRTYFRVRSAAGTWGSKTYVNAGYTYNVTSGWQAQGNFTNAGGEWLLTVYGGYNPTHPSGSGNNRNYYDALILRSTNQGATWSLYDKVVDGYAHNNQAEEPNMFQMLYKNSAGATVRDKWAMLVRYDGFNTINLITTSAANDTLNWTTNSATPNRPIPKFNGAGNPAVLAVQGSPGTLIAVNRSKTTGDFPVTYIQDQTSTYWISRDNGESWIGPFLLDNRQRTITEKFMYGSVLDFPLQGCYIFVWAQERNGAYGQCDIYMRKVPYGSLGSGAISPIVNVERIVSRGTAPVQDFPNSSVSNFVFGPGAMGQTPITTTTTNSNIAIGRKALERAGTLARWNIALGGDSTLQNLTSARYTVALGDRIMGGTAGFTGHYNTLINDRAGMNITSGEHNFFTGSTAGVNTTTGSRNIGLGFASLPSLTTGSRNYVIGADAGAGIVASNDNIRLGRTPSFGDVSNVTAIGNGTSMIDVSFVYSHTRNILFMGEAGNTTTFPTASNLIGAGPNSLVNNTTGTDNVALGNFTLQSNTTGYYNTALGSHNVSGDGVLQANTEGYYNTAVGAGAGSTTTTGDENTFIGGLAGNDATATNNRNTLVGYQAGRSIVGSNNTWVGSFNSGGGTFNGTVLLSSGASEKKFFANSTTVAIGRDVTTTPAASAILDVQGTQGGVLINRLTTTERNAISSPATGLLIYNTTTNQFDYYNGTAWGAITGTGDILNGGNAGVVTIGSNDNTLNLEAGGTTWNSITSTGNHTVTIDDNISNGYVMAIEGGGGNVLTVNTTNGAEITSIGTTSIGSVLTLGSERTVINGSQGIALRTISASGASGIANGDFHIRLDATTGAKTLTLPTPTYNMVLQFFRFDNNPATIITFTGTINGVVNPTTTGANSPVGLLANQYSVLELKYNGTSWEVSTSTGDILNNGNAGAVVIGSNSSTTAIESNGTTRLSFGSTGDVTSTIPDNTTGALLVNSSDGQNFITATTANAAPRLVLGSAENGGAVGQVGIRYEDVQSITSTGSFTATKSTIGVNLASTGTVTADLTGWPTATTVASNFTIINVDALGAGVDVTVALTGATWHSGSNPVLTPGQSVNCKLINGVLYPI